MSHPFEPPAVDRVSLMSPWLLVVGGWALAGACCGTAVGLTVQLVFGVPSAATAFALGGLLAFSAMGAGALAVERSWARHRPELVDGFGRRSRPVHGVLLGVPVAVALPSLVWLVVVGSVSVGSVWPAIVFGGLAIAVGLAGRRVWSSHHLARALELLEGGERDAAFTALERLVDTRLVTLRTRTAARLNLAQLALTDGDADGALRWSEHVSGGPAGAMADVVRALAHLLRGDPLETVERSLDSALHSRHLGAVRPEADAVRVLLVWRRDGRDEARVLADRLYGPGASALHGALLSASRGDGDAGPDVAALRGCGLGRAIPELWG